MSRGDILLLGIFLFFIIYLAVRTAIRPLLIKPEEKDDESNNLSLMHLRDISVLNNSELQEIIKLYQNKGLKKRELEQYLKYTKVLKELKEVNYLTEDGFNDKMYKLKKHYKVD